MTVIAVGNRGGSAGKTTAVVNIGARLAQLGYTVQINDLDAQGNASHWLGHREPEGPGTREVLFDRVPLAAAARPVDGFDNFTVVPVHTEKMEGVEIELSMALAGEQRLRLALQAEDDGDDIVRLLDCPGSLGTLTVSALVAADVALTASTPGEKETEGVAKFEQTVDTIREHYNPRLHLRGVIPSIVPPESAGHYYRDVIAAVRAGWGELVTPPIRRSVRVPESYSRQTPLCLWAPHDGATLDIEAVVSYLLGAGIIKQRAAR